MDLVNKEPLVSVCVPSYNNEKTIKATIDCILNQTYKNWELIIADDCSKDGTVDVIKTYNDPRITLNQNKRNLGLGGNLNEAMKGAKGEFVKLICGDDTIYPDCIEKQVKIFLSCKYPGVVLVISNRDLIDTNGKVLMVRKFPFGSGLISAKKAISLNLLFGTNIIGEPHVGLVKREIISKTGPYDDSNPFCIDIDYWFRVLLNGDLYVIPETLASFRVSKESSSSKIKNDQAKLFRQFAKKVYDDKRFKINYFQYLMACEVATLMQVMRRYFIKYFIR